MSVHNTQHNYQRHILVYNILKKFNKLLHDFDPYFTIMNQVKIINRKMLTSLLFSDHEDFAN